MSKFMCQSISSFSRVANAKTRVARKLAKIRRREKKKTASYGWMVVVCLEGFKP